VIQINSMSVTYGSTQVLNIDQPLTIENGDVVAVLGKNGAGKTTFIDALPAQLSYSVHFQENEYNALMTVAELIRLIIGQKIEPKSMEQVKAFDIEQILSKRISSLSGGESQRLTLFLVLQHEADVFVFDELTSGMDFLKRGQMMQIVRKKTKGRTVIVATHYFEEITNWANKLLLLDQGYVLFWGSPNQLIKQHPHHSVVRYENSDQQFTKAINLSGIRTVPWDDTVVAAVAQNPEEQEVIFNLLNKKGISAQVETASLYSSYILASARLGKMERAI